jgi:hypothetical protein
MENRIKKIKLQHGTADIHTRPIRGDLKHNKACSMEFAVTAWPPIL